MRFEIYGRAPQVHYATKTGHMHTTGIEAQAQVSGDLLPEVWIFLAINPSVTPRNSTIVRSSGSRL